MKLSELKIKTPAELLELAQSLGIENISRAKKQTLIFAILKYIRLTMKRRFWEMVF